MAEDKMTKIQLAVEIEVEVRPEDDLDDLINLITEALEEYEVAVKEVSLLNVPAETVLPEGYLE